MYKIAAFSATAPLIPSPKRSKRSRRPLVRVSIHPSPAPIETRDGAHLHTLAIIPCAPARAALFLHDFMTDHRLFSRLLPPLSALCPAHAMLAYDMRGFGRSSAPAALYSRDHDLEDVVVAALPPPLRTAPLDLVGVGLGGVVALEYALRHPDRVRSVTVVGSGLPGHAWTPHDLLDITPAQDAARMAVENRMRGLERGTAETEEDLDVVKWKKEFIKTSGVWAEALGGGERRVVRDLLEMAKTYRGFHFYESEDFVEAEIEEEVPLSLRLGEMKVPVLVMVGEKDSVDFRVIAEEIWNGLGGSAANSSAVGKVCVLGGVGHFAVMEGAAEVAQRLADFWSGLDGKKRGVEEEASVAT